MDGSKMNIDGEAYNNPFDLVSPRIQVTTPNKVLKSIKNVGNTTIHFNP